MEMCPLSEAILAAAARAMADLDGAEERVLHEYRKDARAIAAAVLIALAGTKSRPGVMPWDHDLSDHLLALADEIGETGKIAA